LDGRPDGLFDVYNLSGPDEVSSSRNQVGK
jgi:hypothetical protein